jgi:hypothetical protein
VMRNVDDVSSKDSTDSDVRLLVIATQVELRPMGTLIHIRTFDAEIYPHWLHR